MERKTDREMFWQERIEPYLKKDGKFRGKLKEREEGFFKDDRKKEYAGKKLILAKKVAIELGWIRWIEAILVTGSVATGWARKDDDIDVMIMCQNKRLWICRAIVTCWLLIRGYKLRNFSNNKNEGDRLCFNLWLEERSLEINRDRRNILTALDLAWARPVLERGKIVKLFYEKNKWIKKYLKFSSNKAERNYNRINNLALDWLNFILYKLQYWYMKRKISNELIALDRAYFHPQGRLDFGRI